MWLEFIKRVFTEDVELSPDEIQNMPSIRDATRKYLAQETCY